MSAQDMNDTDISSSFAPPPPPPPCPVLPPPPPPGPLVPPGSSSLISPRAGFDDVKNVLRSNLQSMLKVQSDEDVKKFIREQITRTFNLDQDSENASSESRNFRVVSWYQPVRPVLQSGPSCGLAALCMALELVSEGRVYELDDMLSLARSMNFTKQGEMFSAENLLSLARRRCDCEGEVIDLAEQDEEKSNSIITSELLRKSVILVPYDRDFNNEPCMKRGHKAHWAVLNGLVYMSPLSDMDTAHICGASVQQDEIISTVNHMTWQEGGAIGHVTREEGGAIGHVTCDEGGASGGSADKESEYSSDVTRRSVHVYAMQGESAGPRLWNLRTLLKSNAQLVELSPKISDNVGDFCINCDIKEGLCGKIVVLKKKRKMNSVK